MKFYDLDDKEYGRCIEPYQFDPDDGCRSNIQLLVGEELLKLFPSCSIFTEMPAWGTGLFLDFFIPSLRLVVECDGSQHDSFNKFFHGDLAGFARTKRNDQIKEQWCLKNGFAMCRILNRDIPKLKEKIYDATRKN